MTFRIGAFLLAAALALGVYYLPAGAQTDTTISVEPAQVSVQRENNFQIEITVSKGVNVNAFDVRITYDQQRLSLQSWAHGDYLSAINCLNAIKSPGLLELGCTQIQQEPVSGDGVLLALDFTTLALGQAAINIDSAVFADSAGNKSQPDRVGGMVSIESLPTYTPTATLTQTPTPTQTRTWTVTPTSTQTAAPDQPTDTAADPTATVTATPAGTDPSSQEVEPTQFDITSTNTPISQVIAPSTPTPTPEFGFQTATVVLTSDAGGVALGTVQVGQLPEREDLDSTDLSETNQNAVSEIEGSEPLSLRKLSLTWNGILLGVLTFSILAIVVMTIILIRRKKQKEEDLLL
ncbi:MAG: cohesin domain-containing protein [Brevefilum sp.]